MTTTTALPAAALRLAASAALLLAASAAQAQVYRTTGPDGRPVYTDKPPTTAAPAPRAASGGGGSSASGGLPYELNQAAQRYPVTLYTSNDCAPCGSGRSLLTRRGVPFTEKTINTNADISALKNQFGNASLPVLTVGAQQVKGYAESTWTQYLDAAGYPKESRLPASYRAPAPSPLAPATAQPVTTQPAQNSATDGGVPSDARIAPERNANNPAGIRF